MNTAGKFSALGFLRAAACSHVCYIGNCEKNAESIISCIQKAENLDCTILLLSQLAVSGVSCGNLFYQHLLLQKSKEILLKIVKETEHTKVISVIGFPFAVSNKLYSCSAICAGGKIWGIVPQAVPKELKAFFSEYEHTQPILDVSYDLDIPYQIPFGQKLIFKVPQPKVNFTAGKTGTDSTLLTLLPFVHPSYAFSLKSIENHTASFSKEHHCAAIFAGAGIGESAAHCVFAGECGICEDGTVLASKSFITDQDSNFTAADIDIEFLQNKRMQSAGKSSSPQLDFKEVEIDIQPLRTSTKSTHLLRSVNRSPFLPHIGKYEDKKQVLEAFLDEIEKLQVLALTRRLKHLNCKKAVLGISGGIDSTCALLTVVRCFDFLNLDRKGITAITMPCFGTTDRTKNNAVSLAELLGCTVLSISIKEAVMLHFKDIEHDISNYDITYENAQARERTQILMDKANQIGGIVIGTGDLSEAALGWMTYAGDHISMYSLNASLPKTILKELIRHNIKQYYFFTEENNKTSFQEILIDILNTPVSPELLPTSEGKCVQKTEELLGSYELHEFFLYYTVEAGFSPQKIFVLAEKAFSEKPENQELPVYSRSEILAAMNVFYKRFFSQQFKRNCTNDGAYVLPFNISPFGNWKMPSDADAGLWAAELDFLNKSI